jgi:site-specific recombinase XerD
LETVLEELNIVKQEREEKKTRKKARANRKRLPKRDPINYEIYSLLIKESEGPGYTKTRTRAAICLLTVTGIRISELLPLKVGQLETLLDEGWISIDRLKKGPANHKAFLTREGKKLVKTRKKDFQFLSLMKDKDSYLFTSDRKPNQMLRRETIMTDVNKGMHFVSKQIPSQPNIISHSFRIDYISKLWKDTRDIEFVKQTIGHSSLTSTSGYVNHMTDKERENRICSGLHTGLILFDRIDIICMSFSAGFTIAYCFKKYRNYRRIKITGEDTIVDELKRKSPINMFSEKGNPLKLPLMRGGDNIRGFSLMIRNKKLAQIMMAIVNVRKNPKKLRLLQDVLFILNRLLTTSTGLHIVAGGSLSYAQIILITFPSTIGGFLMGTIYAYSLASAVLPIAILFGRGIEDIPDLYEKCRFICKAAEEYHNQQLMLEMENLDSLLVDAVAALQLPIDKVPLLCTE